MTDREKLIQMLRVPIYPHESKDPAEVVADYLLANGVTFATNNSIPYKDRCEAYRKALAKWGVHAQMIVAIEELSECQKEICKILRGGENFPHLAEEIADATITLEQMRLLFNINDAVCVYMDSKVQRLDNNLRKGGGCHEG